MLSTLAALALVSAFASPQVFAGDNKSKQPSVPIGLQTMPLRTSNGALEVKPKTPKEVTTKKSIDVERHMLFRKRIDAATPLIAPSQTGH